MTPNICLIGRAGAGKSTVADLLINRTDLGYEKLSFAAPLKAGTGTSTDREVLQRVGQGVRDLCPDFWVNLAMAAMKERETFDPERDHPLDEYHTPAFVVDDCRYKNEYYTLLDRGFRFIRVIAPEYVRLTRLAANGKDGGDLNAESETQLDDVMVDHTIVNTTDDMADLEYQVARILNLIGR